MPTAVSSPQVAHITHLRYYPIKSCAGTAADTVSLDRYGIVGDRRFLLVRAENGHFLTQRDYPQMARLHPHLSPDGTLTVEGAGHAALVLPASIGDNTSPREVTVWKYTGNASDTGDEAAAWFSEVMRIACRLVRLPLGWSRPPGNASAVRSDDRVAFADGYPLLLTHEASLSDLNRHLGPANTIPMNRFRPNIVVSGGRAWAEDGWATLIHRPSGSVFRAAKPCARCSVITVDQETGMPTGPEPLRTLATFRRDTEGKVTFGLNLLHDGGDAKTRVLHVGDELIVA